MAELSSDNKSNNESDDTNNDKSDNINDDKSYNISDDKSKDINDDKSKDINDDKSKDINDDGSNEINDKSNNITDCDPRESIRRQFYKNRIRKDNIKLEIDDSTPQEERRRLLLEYQKKYRDEAVNAARGILQEFSVSENKEYKDEEYTDEEHMNEEEYMDTEECMDAEKLEVEDCASYYRMLPDESKMNRMMLSEWMLDVPQDFTENWIMVPCPTGKRVRLISGWGETRAYSRKGDLHGVFPSALPGGNPDSEFHHSAAIDCIWIRSRKLFYILDVLYWSLLPFINCETEFRLFWINNKFQEIPELKERNNDINKYPILTLPNVDCNSNLSLALTKLDNELHPLDGLLFYHRQALYTYGHTPLVTWLKPFMLPELLGIAVPSPLDEKPNDYINFEHHMQKRKTKKKQWATTKTATNSMEVSVV